MSDQPTRGAREAYERYLAGMDASMRQKVALTAAHLLGRGRIADMGMGSGAGSHALAALYPQLEVVGVDVDPTMVNLARERYALPNLSFVVGDVATPVFGDETLDGVFDSSVLHHVTSFGGYDHENAARALAIQSRALKEHGVLVVRDFVEPNPNGDEGPARSKRADPNDDEGPARDILLDLPASDGDDSDNPRRCSTAALFERFAHEFRSLHPTPGFTFEPEPAPRPGWKRYRVAHKLAAEFLLRKDYRADWAAEVKEEYTYFTQGRFERVFAALGLRVLASTPIRNPWIVRHRLLGKCALSDLTGAPLELPPTNIVVVGERVPRGEGVRFREAGSAPPLGYLEPTCWTDARGGRTRDLVRRPHVTVDVVPHFDAYGDTFVVARASYPRPMLRAETGGGGALDGSRAPEYVTEPLVVVQADKPIAQTVEEALREGMHLEDRAVRRFRPGGTYYPSPGGIQEEVRAMLVEIEPLFVQDRIANTSGWSTSGRLRAIEAEQVLRAAQVGGLPDARLELNVYELLLQLGRGVGPWIGEAIDLRDGPAPAAPATMRELAARARRRVFSRAPPAASTGFLELRCAMFEELGADGAVVARQPLELVVPRSLGACTVVAAPLRRHAGEAWLGVDDDDLPAAQCFEGHSELLVAPAWRLPRGVTTTTPARAWMLERLSSEYGVQAGDTWELGGRWHPSPGVTPEVVHAVAVEVTNEHPAPNRLRWTPLADAIAARGELRDGHLRIVALRAAHALGMLL
jgi:ubiquinone/menaquinone biosynthesis C-methylase UbiE